LKHESGLLREFLGRSNDIIECPNEAQKILFGPTRRRIPENYSLKSPALLGPVQNQEHYMNGIAGRRHNFVEPLLGFLEAAYAEFGELTGRKYGLISEYNTEKADTVFVALGSAAENIEAGVDYIRERDGVEVGVIHINVLRPFPEVAIVNALHGKKNVIILERSDDQLAGDNPLTRDIRAALSKAVMSVDKKPDAVLPKFDKYDMPNVYSGVYGLGSRDFRPEDVLGAYEYVLKGRPRNDGKKAVDGARFLYLGIDHPYAVVSEDKPSLLPKGSIAIRFHSIGGWGAITTGKNLSEVLGQLGTYASERDYPGEDREMLHVSANPKYGSEKKGAPTNYFLVVGPDRVRVNCDLRHVDVVLCCDPKAFTHTNPIEGLRRGSAFIWESAEDNPQEAWQRIPVRFRQEIIDNEIKLYTLPGFEVAKAATPRKDLQLRMQGNTFLGAFFKVSSFLNDFKIPEEEFLRVVEEQYEKKFGKFGEAVVASNMTVMTEGLKRVMPLPYGAVDAPDTSSMRGAMIAPCGQMPVDESEEATDVMEGFDSSVNPHRVPMHTKEAFASEFLAGLGYNQPSSVLASTGIMAAATGKDMSKFVARRLIPKYNPENCTQCMKCITACPDTALPNTAQDIKTVLYRAIRNYVKDSSQHEALFDLVSKSETNIRATMVEEAKKKGGATPFNKVVMNELRNTANGNGETLKPSFSELEAILEKVPMAYSQVLQIFGVKEKRNPGQGGLFSIIVSDLCKGCAQCVVECGDHEALVMVDESEAENADMHTAMNFLKLLPDTPREYLGLYNPETPEDSKAAVLQYHLMQQSKYTSLLSGDGACAGCGEKTILHMLASITESYMRPIFHRKADRLIEKAKQLRANGAQLLDEFEKSNPEGHAIFRRTVCHVLMALGGETLEETERQIEERFSGDNKELAEIVATIVAQDAFNHKHLQTIEGLPSKGMSVMGMTANTGCSTVYGSTPPSNPHPYPWMNSLFQDGTTIGWLVAESFIVNHARRSVLPERFADSILSRFEYDHSPISEAEYFSYTHFHDTYMTDDEMRELPKVWAIGGDGGMGDIGFQNLSKTVLQNRPNCKVLMLDTQVYSNTGGQNSDSSYLPGGSDMNQFGKASQGKITERKEVAECLTAGHGSAYVAQLSMANSANLLKGLLDALEYRGACFIQTYTTCQPEHGVGDSESTVQAQGVRDSRGFIEFVYNPQNGEGDKFCFSLKGNPNLSDDWCMKVNRASGQMYAYTVAQWAITEGRFRRHIELKVPEGVEQDNVFLEDILARVTQQDVVYRRVFDPKHYSYIPTFGVYAYYEHADGSFRPFLMSRQMVIFCIERRKNWRTMQSRAGLQNNDYAAQRVVLAKLAKGEISTEDIIKQGRELIKQEKEALLKK